MPKSILGIYGDSTESEIRYRISEPELFEEDSFKTLNIGEHHRLIRAINKNNKKYMTQSVRVDKEFAEDKKEIEVTKKLIRQAKSEK